MRNEGVKGLYWVGEPTNLSKLLSEAASLGIKFDWVLTDANHYDPQVTSVGDAADGTYVRTAFYPFLDRPQAKQNPATQQYLDLIDQYDPGGKIANLGAQGLSAWLLFAKAANECGADLTRDCVWEKAKAITEWTGGGLHAPQDLKTGDAIELLRAARGRGAEVRRRDDINAERRHLQLRRRERRQADRRLRDRRQVPNPAYATDPKPSNCS